MVLHCKKKPEKNNNAFDNNVFLNWTNNGHSLQIQHSTFELVPLLLYIVSLQIQHSTFELVPLLLYIVASTNFLLNQKNVKKRWMFVPELARPIKLTFFSFFSLTLQSVYQ